MNNKHFLEFLCGQNHSVYTLGGVGAVALLTIHSSLEITASHRLSP